MTKKMPTSFRLSGQAKTLLKQLSREHGVSQNALIEMLLRKEARELNLREAGKDTEGE